MDVDEDDSDDDEEEDSEDEEEEETPKKVDTLSIKQFFVYFTFYII